MFLKRADTLTNVLFVPITMFK